MLGRWKQALDVFIKAESLLQRADAEVYYYIGKIFISYTTNEVGDVAHFPQKRILSLNSKRSLSIL